MKQIKVLILFLLILALLPSCRGVKEKLSMKKKQGVDEFLIEKKNPLVMPPDINDLPKPQEETDLKVDENGFKEILISNSTDNQKSKSISSGSLEESIIKKIEQ